MPPVVVLCLSHHGMLGVLGTCDLSLNFIGPQIQTNCASNAVFNGLCPGASFKLDLDDIDDENLDFELMR